MIRWALGFVALFMILGGSLFYHEWQLFQDIEVTQKELQLKLNARIEKTETFEDLNQEKEPGLIFQDYHLPVFMVAHRFFWPPFRKEVFVDWQKEIDDILNNQTKTRESFFQENLQKEIERLREEKEPGVDRLMDILKEAERFASQALCVQTAQEEVHFFQELMITQDEEHLQALKTEGAELIKALRRKLKKMDQKTAGDFFLSGQYLTEIEAPLMESIMKLRHGEARKESWQQLKTRLLALLSQKQMQIAQSESKQKAELDRIFEEAFQQQISEK